MFDSVASFRTNFPLKWVLDMERSRTRPSILVVEDYADSRQILKLLLEDVGYSVVTAGSGKEALDAAANYHIDLALVDYGLPDMTGANVARRLRQFGNGMTALPIVMLTAFDGYEYRRQAHEAGCNAYLVKPPDFEMLRGTIERLLRERPGVSQAKIIQDFKTIPREAART